jgi:hypothetical protein
MTKKTKRDLKNMIVNILSYITIIIMVLTSLFVAYIAIDFLGLMAWVISGQTPTGFYIGRISYIIISLMF